MAPADHKIDFCEDVCQRVGRLIPGDNNIALYEWTGLLKQTLKPKTFETRISCVEKWRKQQADRLAKQANDCWIKISSFSAAVGALAGSIALSVSFYTLWVTNAQLNEAQNADRAWLQTTITVTNKLDFSSKNPEIHTDLSMNNVGHLPAYDVEALAWDIVAKQDLYEELSDQFVRCQQSFPTQNVTDTHGIVIFPGQTIDVPRYSGISMFDVESALKLMKENYIQLFVVACVQYRDSSLGQLHYTEAVYPIVNPQDPANVPQVPPSIIPQGTIPPNGKALIPYSWNGPHAT